jgi:hypothetical protein
MKRHERYAYNVNPQAEKVLDTAAALVRFSDAFDFDPKRKKKLLNFVQWLATEVHGKYRCRYVSEAALRAIDTGDFKILRHEHVYRRKDVTAKLLTMKDQKEIRELIQALRGCVVTEEEHRLLGQADRGGVRNGWARYIKADIKVHDRRMGRQKKLYGLALP